MLNNRLSLLLAERNWDGVVAFTDSLSNSLFRTAGPFLAETLAPSLSEEDFWMMTRTLVAHNPKAWLVTLIRSAVKRGISITSDGFRSFCTDISTHPEDVRKTMREVMPALSTPEDILELLRLTNVPHGEQRIAHLLPSTTPAVAFVLFHALKYVEHDRALLVRTVHFLMRQGTEQHFALAALLRAHFGLDEVRGTFSLRVEPYQLSWLEGNFTAFCRALKR